ncbi:MAG: glucose-6-phosphate isomerase [Thermoleophilia bacterium]|nr:glucose-6-phosphate isomerase [Thermoleophilia bacterium]
MSTIAPAEVVERVWARDPTLWTGRDEAEWLGWLDEPARMLERVDQLLEFAATADYDAVVLLGMGGSSLAPEVLRRAFGAASFRVLDTTHPAAVRRLEASLELERTLFVASSKSGGTIETRSHLDYFWERTGGDWSRFVAVTDPGSPLEQLARERGFLDVFGGEPSIGGRYSALSIFGMLPAALMGADVRRLLERAEEMREACRYGAGNPGLELGVALGEAWRGGRDKVALVDVPDGFELWVQQLLAESTGKQGRGLVPVEGDGADVQAHEVRIEQPYELGQEFFRWEFATAVAGSLLGVNPFDQPDVQAAKDKTNAVLERGEANVAPQGSVDELLDGAREGDYVAVCAFIDPEREAALEPLLTRIRETGTPLMSGLGPRYLHSTGQLHKGGPDTALCVHVVDDLGDELPIPGRPFGFRRLIAAQAAGDFEALRERGRRVVRVHLEDVA